jgi:hypothetical protein
VRRYLAARHDPRQVIRDPQAPYYGIKVSERELVPEANAALGKVRLDEWLARSK